MDNLWRVGGMNVSLILMCVTMVPILGVFLRKFSLLMSARRSQGHRQEPLIMPIQNMSWPDVCVQLPVFNEPTQVEGLLRAVAGLDWPDEKLEIQILDDSIDETPRRVADVTQKLLGVRPGLCVRHIRRGSRQGYKAGALNNGLSLSHAEFFAIFDADFRPQHDFLIRLVGRLVANPRAAFVQAMWSYQNESQNFFTRAQATLLNTHFYIEHAGRAASDYAFNFNGSAGVWRREALVQLGGWSDHSVTEDLYLSYRAYLKGWKGILATDVHCESLLPSDLPSFLIQQRRWAKGSGQVLRLLFLDIISRRKFSIRKRIDILFNLLGYAATSMVPFIYAFAFVHLNQKVAQPNDDHGVWLISQMGFGIWMFFWLLIFLIYGANEAHSCFSLDGGRKMRVSIGRRIFRTCFLSLISPLLAVLLFPSFWRGLVMGGKKAELIFNRTPKKNDVVDMQSSDQIVVIASISFITGVAWHFFKHESFALASLFLCHALVLIRFWFSVTNPGAIFTGKSPLWRPGIKEPSVAETSNSVSET